MMITAESNDPLVVFLGAAIALILTSFLGVVGGKWLSEKVSPYWLDTLAGFSFLILAIALVWEATI